MSSQSISNCRPSVYRYQDPEVIKKICSSRYEIIQEEIKKIDPALEIAFIPRTLYELIFIEQCIQEDLE
ncbi:MAG: hypothetical protein WCP39_07415, partial [Chlamydiota bacterium]